MFVAHSLRVANIYLGGDEMIAAHDGDLVWGLWETEAEAVADATPWILVVTCDEITEAQARLVREGNPTWPIAEAQSIDERVVGGAVLSGTTYWDARL